MISMLIYSTVTVSIKLVALLLCLPPLFRFALPHTSKFPNRIAMVRSYRYGRSVASIFYLQIPVCGDVDYKLLFQLFFCTFLNGKRTHTASHSVGISMPIPSEQAFSVVAVAKTSESGKLRKIAENHFYMRS